MATMAMMMTDESDKTCTTKPDPPPPAVFHDFLGGKVATFHGGSDLAPERQVGSQVEKKSCYGPRTDLSVSEISNCFVGSKRSHSDSAFMGSSRDGIPHIIPESSHVMKMLCNTSKGERLRISHYDVPLDGAPTHHVRPISASFMLHPTTGNNASFPRSERSNPMNLRGSSTHYNACGGKSSPVMYQVPSSRFRDSGSGSLVLSQMAADEGSRTGNKGSGVLSSINAASNIVSERSPSGLFPSGCNVKPVTRNSEPESSNPTSLYGLTSGGSRQMTIIYGGQVHVFDDVHPNKADVIMSLAGSNGGSWSTTLPKSSAMAATNDSYLQTGGMITKAAGTSGQAAECSMEAKKEE